MDWRKLNVSNKGKPSSSSHTESPMYVNGLHEVSTIGVSLDRNIASYCQIFKLYLPSPRYSPWKTMMEVV
ncbi:hypothetical protein TRIATDRAFT_258695, partial [Trichoderma atroviride IMI 206040]